MRTLITAAIAFGLIASAASADTMKNCGAAWSAMPADAKAKTTYAAFSKVCLSKTYTVTSNAPAGVTGKCADGTWTTAKTHQGACSGHGGVNVWLPGH